MRSSSGMLALPLGRALLDQDGAPHRVDDARELAERAVPHKLDDAALVLGDERLDQLPAQRLQPGEGAVLVALHQGRVADHVRRQDGGEPPLYPCCRHGRPPLADPGPKLRPGAVTQPARRSIDANA